MHVGLHIAIVQDAFARQQIFNEVGADPALEPGEGRKQSREPSPPDDEEPQPKRRRSTCFPSTASEIARESSTRQLVLIRLKYKVYCSPAPSSFFRIGSSCHPAFYPSYVDEKFKTTYDLSECVSLVLGAPLGQGAVGIVHSASLEVGLESGEVLQRDVIVKLAFSEGQAERLRQEFDIYSVLVKKKATKGILTVHGLFEDTESGALALVMENGGQTLRQREKERLNATQAEQVTTTPEEREAFFNALKGIHAAGILHGDLRADNLLISKETKNIAILDFDCATESADLNSRKSEEACLTDILMGKYSRRAQYYH